MVARARPAGRRPARATPATSDADAQHSKRWLWFLLLPIAALAVSGLLVHRGAASRGQDRASDVATVRWLSTHQPAVPLAELFELVPSTALWQTQWQTVGDLRYTYSGSTAHPALTLVDQRALCVPVCLANGSDPFARTPAAGRGATRTWEAAGNANFKRLFVRDDAPAAPARVLVALPVASGGAPAAQALLDSLAASPRLPSRARTAVDLLLISPHVHRLRAGAHLVRHFRSVARIAFDPDPGSGASADSLAGMFLAAVQHAAGQQPGVDYMLWMEPDVLPIRDFWLDRLVLEAADASPFLVKGAPLAAQDARATLQQLHAFIPTSHFLQIGRSAIYGLWNAGFVRLIEQVLLASPDGRPGVDRLGLPFNEALFAFMLHRQGNVKYFMRYIRYSDYLVLDPGAPRHVSARTFLARGAAPAPGRPCATWQPTLESCFSQEDLRTYGGLQASQYVPFVLAREAHAPPRYLDTCFSPPAGAGACLETDADGSPLPSAGAFEPPARPNILVTVAFTWKQLPRLAHSLLRWTRDEYRPCAAPPGDYSATLLLLQSGAPEDRLTQEFVEMLAGALGPARACFARVAYEFVALSSDTHDTGSAAMFRAMVLGSSSAGHDYAFQMEPDVLPLRPEWLAKVAAEARDASPFWVKGSLGFYHDLDWMQACLTGVPLPPAAPGAEPQSIEMTPLGSWLLGINGNALYALSPEFKAFVARVFASCAPGAPPPARPPLCGEAHRMGGGMRCDAAGACAGAFDSSLVDYMVASWPRFRSMLLLYRYSDFIINGLSPNYLHTCVPANSYFVHYPTRMEPSILRETCPGRYQERFVREVERTHQRKLLDNYPPPAMTAAFVQEMRAIVDALLL